MSERSIPEVLVGANTGEQPSLPLATDGVQRDVWTSAFGQILIEVQAGAVFVNGERVHFQDLLKEQGTQCSMSRTGEVGDNSATLGYVSPIEFEKAQRAWISVKGSGSSPARSLSRRTRRSFRAA